MPSSFQPPQNGYPYDGRTHTYTSPSGMYYPAVPGSSAQPQPYFTAQTQVPTRQADTDPMSTAALGQYSLAHRYAGPSGVLAYGPGDWRPERPASGLPPATRPSLATAHGQSAPATPYAAYPASGATAMRIHPTRTTDVGYVDGQLATSAHLTPVAYSASVTPTRNPSPLSFRSERASNTSQTSGSQQRSQGRERNRIGPPPKARLGGVGGKTWDELQLGDRSVSEPLPSSRTSAPNPTTLAETASTQETTTCSTQKPTAEEYTGPTYKGNPILFKLPPQSYSPPDSPVLLPQSKKAAKGDEAAPPRLPRKQAFPWPERPSRGPPETIPLPLSPTDTAMEGRRRSIVSGLVSRLRRDDSERTVVEGRETLVVIPDPMSWRKLKAELDERMRRAEIARAVLVKPNAVDSGSQEKGRSEHGPPLHSKEVPEGREGEQADRGEGKQTLTTKSTPARRNEGVRLVDSAFVQRQLGGVLKMRGRTNEASAVDGSSAPSSHVTETARPTATACSAHEGQSIADVETPISALTDVKEEVPARREEVAEPREPAPKTPVETTTMEQRETTAKSLQTPSMDATGTGEQQADERVMQEQITPEEASRTMVESRTSTGRKSVIKLGNFDGFLGRQLSGTGLLGPSTRAAPTQAQGQAPWPQDSTDEVDEALVPLTREVGEEHGAHDMPSSDAAGGTKKRSRSIFNEPSQSYTASGEASPTKTSSRLRADATSFQPRSMVAFAAFDHVPEGKTTFDFSSPSRQSGHNKGRSSHGSISLRASAAPFMPKNMNGNLQAFVFGQTEPAASLAPSKVLADSPDLQDTADQPQIDRDDADHGLHEPFEEQAKSTPPGSPAAELHGIFASTPTGSMLDEDLFYRPPRSDISDIAGDEVEHFDPVSYSYDPGASDLFDPSLFRTSTPVRGRELLDAHFSSSPEADTDAADELQVLPPALGVPSPSITVDPPAPHARDDKQKFREWVYPTPGSGHETRPSISRRHTFDSPHEDQSPVQAGVASTFASRVGDLRAFLATSTRNDHHLRTASAQGHVLHSSKSSVEFPMRSPTKTLGIVNGTMNTSAVDLTVGADSPVASHPAADIEALAELKDRVLGLQNTIADLVQAQERQTTSLDEALNEQVKVVLDKLHAIPPPAKVDLTGVLATLEQQSTLISTLASQIQTQQAHRSDHFVPLLEGQQALLDRFDQFDETRETVANELERLNSAVNGRNTEEAERLQRLLDHELLALSTERETGAQQLQTRLSAENSENKRLRGEVKRTAQELQLANQDVHSLRQQLGDATNATDAALAARKHQSDLELANAKANNERLQADLLHAQTQQLEAAKKRIGSIESNDQKVTIALAELRAVITASSDQLANRVTSLETRVEERQPSSAVLEAAPSVQGVSAEESAHLHEELREKDRTRQLDAQRHHLELEKLQLQLENEKIARTKADEQVMKLEGWYREEIDKRATAEVIARERTYVAQLQEARIASLLQDVHHWRSFAMSFDRDAARQFQRSEPFKGFYSANLTARHSNRHNDSGQETNGPTTPAEESPATPAAVRVPHPK